MTFLNPALLWTLAALAPLAAIYFLKVRPRKKPVTAYFLWQKIFTEKRSSALFKRLRDLWSLLLMALAFAAIALALAEPDFEGDERKDLLIIVDNSASMSAMEGSSTRLQAAQQKAREMITALNGSQRAAVASLADRLNMHVQPTRHRRSLLEAVDAIHATALPSRSDALKSVQTSQDGLKNMRVIFITDACLDDASLLSGVEVWKIPGEAPNIGIVRADLRPVPGAAQGLKLGLFIVLHSTFKEVTKLDLTLKQEDSQQIIKLIPLEVRPGLNDAVTLFLEDAQAGRWSANLDLKDALETDNHAWLQVPERVPLPVAVLAENAFFLENAVRAFEMGEQQLTLAEKPDSAELTLALGRTPEKGSALIFHPQGDSPLWTGIGEELPAPVPSILIKDHPLLRYLDAEAMNFTGARQLKAPAGAVVLVADTSGVPLIYLLRQGDSSSCVVNLDPLAAQFYLSAWFPVLTHNAALHLSQREAPLPATLPTGSLQPISLPAGVTAVSVKTPSGTALSFTASSALRLEETGFYELSHGDEKSILACSLVSPAESGSADAAILSTTRPLAQGQSPSYWLMVLGLAVLVTESALYHRRKVG